MRSFVSSARCQKKTIIFVLQLERKEREDRDMSSFYSRKGKEIDECPPRVLSPEINALSTDFRNSRWIDSVIVPPCQIDTSVLSYDSGGNGGGGGLPPLNGGCRVHGHSQEMLPTSKSAAMRGNGYGRPAIITTDGRGATTKRRQARSQQRQHRCPSSSCPSQTSFDLNGIRSYPRSTSDFPGINNCRN